MARGFSTEALDRMGDVVQTDFAACADAPIGDLAGPFRRKNGGFLNYGRDSHVGDQLCDGKRHEP